MMLAETIVRESRGSPYFVYELVEYLREGGDLAEGSTNSSDISASTMCSQGGLVSSRREASRLLEVVALAGQPLRQAVACRAVGLGASGYSGLTELRSQHLVRGTGLGSLDEVETYHDRIRETVVNMLTDDRRRELHGCLARELEGAGGADAETLAVHFEGAGELAAAGRYYGLAADEASEALAFDRAVKLYRHSLDLGPGDPDGRAAANGAAWGMPWPTSVAASRRRNAYQKAAVDADQVEQIELAAPRGLPVPGERAHRRGTLGLRSDPRPDGLEPTKNAAKGTVSLVAQPRPPRPARAAIQRATRNPGSQGEARVNRHLPIGGRRHQHCRRDPGADYQTRSLLLALDAGEPLRIALALGWEAVHVACQGRPTWRRTERLVAAAADVAGRLGHPHALGMASLSAGAAEFLIGRYRSGPRGT